MHLLLLRNRMNSYSKGKFGILRKRYSRFAKMEMAKGGVMVHACDLSIEEAESEA